MNRPQCILWPLGIALLAAACSRIPAVFITMEVPQAGPALTATLACTSQASDVKLSLTPEADAVSIELAGLQPGEFPVIVVWQAVPGVGSRRSEITLPKAVGAEGRLSIREGGLEPVADGVPNTWQVQVTHAHGVACGEFTIP